MTSEELSNEVTACIESVRHRIITTGDLQYSQGQKQKIEFKSDKQIIIEAIEELDDLIVYAAVLRTRLNNLRLP